LDTRFQLKYTLAVVVISTLISLVLGTFLYRAQSEAFETSRENSQLLTLDDPELDAEMQAELAKEDEKIRAHNRKTLFVLVLSLGGLVLALTFLGIIITHKIAGPAYAMRLKMSQIADGKLPIVRPLRKGDELKAVAEELRRMANNLRDREIKDVEALTKAITSLKDDGSDNTKIIADLEVILRQKEERIQTD
ncbi:MAG: hypothetical protein JRJ19_06535, partial [Deltaproteobacteria bacterium]|nr:hypothetical protein [Deltaproteobacteria bacterium]